MINTKIIIFFIICLFTVSGIHAEEYDVAAYLDKVAQYNPDLLMLFKDTELAGTDVALARAAFLPSVGVQGGYNRNFTERTQSMAVASSPGGGPLIWQDVRTNYDNELSLGIGVNQLIFSAAAFTNYSKAKIAQAIKEQSLEAAREAVFCAAKKLYLRAQLSLLIVEIRETSEQFTLEQYQRVERRYQAGAATEMDLLSAEVNWRTKTDAAREARRNAEMVLLAFRDLAGIPHEREITLTESHTALPEMPELPVFGDILAGRADYRTLMLSKDLAAIDTKAARNAFFPEVSASFSYGLGGMGNGSSLAGDYHYNSAVLGINVRIPISSGGARLARVKAARLENEKLTIAMSQKETAIESELIELQLRLADAAERHESAYRTVETARRAVTLAQTAYTSGLATFLSVADAQDRLDQVWLNFVNVDFEYLSALYDWELATGLSG